MTEGINFNKEILTWAIARAGYNIKDFFLINPNVQTWLEGGKKPTVKQLETLSKMLYIPFGYFFLSEPPKEELPIPFFRTKDAQTDNVSINVYDTILLLQQRQTWLREYLQDNEFQPLNFVGKFQADLTHKNIETIANDIKNKLGLQHDWASKYRSWEEALKDLIEKIESIGIITVFNGVVGNNSYRKINIEECRGFVLVDEFAPFMFVNNSDAKAAQMFTIIHELAHIWTGYSAGFDFRKLMPANDPVELLCDKVAAEFLVPEQYFHTIWNQMQDIKSLSKYFKVSEIVIARRALDLGKISKTKFFAFYEEYKNRELRKRENSEGGDFYATTRKRLSLAFAAHVNNAVKSGKLLYREAYKLTSLKGNTYQNFIAMNF